MRVDDAAFDPGASSDAGLAITYTSLTPAVATVSGNTLTFTINPAGSTPNYLVLRINSLQKLVILADSSEKDAPSTSDPSVHDVVAKYGADPSGATACETKIQAGIAALTLDAKTHAHAQQASPVLGSAAGTEGCVVHI